ncbi:hypothetical protein BU25DRAFT_414769 [Macroventuria anomochaeta]|uniref:Uncharacterized protein n=1 Tax=Macroventuria anomochaeta TaxID=301207 RepID=A0ACB6RNM4_9PLEO|nr:uncharacterized protein BU25DRAFT_414769 [Macroventuria anomochaeta]KAF2623005.1 hypothetical protein BU25DRAFT_414769 [Macroventuria anomochaeta]
MASLRVPAPTPVPTSTLTDRRSSHMPLSSHGMPKAPRALSPEQPHRFSAIILPNSPAESLPKTPLSPGPMSPPMSAKSFGTFIDSAPPTPAYSPRQMGEEWGHSQITILRPMSSSSLPSSPTEPAWEMMAPVKQPANPVPALEGCTLVRPKLPTATSTPLALSKPVKKTKQAAPTRATTTDVSKLASTTSKEDALRREAEAQARKLVGEEEAAKSPEATEKSQPEPSPKTDTAPLGKLATRMKSLLRRNTSEKKKEKKDKPAQEFDRLEDAHWSEM